MLGGCCYTWAREGSSFFGAMNSTFNTSSSTGSAGFKCSGAHSVAKKKQPVFLFFKANGFTWLDQFQHNTNSFGVFFKHKTKCCNELLPVTIWF